MDFDGWFSERYPEQHDTLALLMRYQRAVLDYPGNLVGARDSERFQMLHLVDSLEAPPRLDLPWTGRWLDLGCGAGLPGLPLAAVCDGMTLTLFDSREKPIRFLEEFLAEHPALPARAVLGRAEEIGHERAHRGTYHGVLARAVGSISILVELALPLLRVGGSLVLYRGKDPHTELSLARHALAELSGEVTEVVEYHLQPEGQARCLVVIEKRAETPDRYPRRVGIPHKRPL